MVIFQDAVDLPRHAAHSSAQGLTSDCLAKNNSARDPSVHDSAGPMRPWVFAAALGSWVGCLSSPFTTESSTPRAESSIVTR